MPITTRFGNADDFQHVVPMMRQFRLRQQAVDPALYALHPDAEPRFRRWIGQLAEDPRARLIVAEDGGEIVGFLYVTVEQNLPIYAQDEYALVPEWWVEPAFRRRGAGRALIDRAVAELRSIGIRQVRVRMVAGGGDGQALLQGCGFRSGPCEMVRDLPGES